LIFPAFLDKPQIEMETWDNACKIIFRQDSILFYKRGNKMAGSFEAMKAYMDSAIERTGLSGIDCIVYQDHREIFRHTAGYGEMESKTPVQRDAFYNVYSGTKMITCVAALQLIERGLMLLSDPLYFYLPEFKDMMVKHSAFFIYPAKKHIRIVDLFTMMAGINYELDTPEKRKLQEETGGDFDTREFVKAIAKEPLLFEPGEGWDYSYCHDVLGAVIEVISGMSLDAYFQKYIFEPLGMMESSFTLAEDKKHRLAPQYSYDAATGTVSRISSDCLGRAGLRHESGGGALIMTADDYIKFADALACGGVGANGAKIISEQAIRLMSTNRLSGKSYDDFKKIGVPDGIGYGLGVGVCFDPKASGSLVQEGAFYWGGIGGVQNLIDTKNRLSYFVGQHTFRSPVHLLRPYMLNVLYGCI